MVLLLEEQYKVKFLVPTVKFGGSKDINGVVLNAEVVRKLCLINAVMNFTHHCVK